MWQISYTRTISEGILIQKLHEHLDCHAYDSPIQPSSVPHTKKEKEKEKENPEKHTLKLEQSHMPLQQEFYDRLRKAPLKGLSSLRFYLGTDQAGCKDQGKFLAEQNQFHLIASKCYAIRYALAKH